LQPRKILAKARQLIQDGQALGMYCPAPDSYVKRKSSFYFVLEARGDLDFNYRAASMTVIFEMGPSIFCSLAHGMIVRIHEEKRKHMTENSIQPGENPSSLPENPSNPPPPILRKSQRLKQVREKIPPPSPPAQRRRTKKEGEGSSEEEKVDNESLVEESDVNDSEGEVDADVDLPDQMNQITISSKDVKDEAKRLTKQIERYKAKLRNLALVRELERVKKQYKKMVKSCQ
jgi:hypothetical protein